MRDPHPSAHDVTRRLEELRELCRRARRLRVVDMRPVAIEHRLRIVARLHAACPPRTDAGRAAGLRPGGTGRSE